ncbi:WD40 repeat domain-containing protein [Paucibacter sp. B51]|uniref:WD40 repeat domain-containing protein n=1 Tax=Paucibacter sp. B51 TaxID=2993315 RepID=UPI0022EC072B|nr:WD40 repeat domain-containing protein [Paucibacter sp. B51]
MEGPLEAQAAAAGAVQLNAQNPWPGLAAYDERAQDYFKGRDEEKGELLRLVSSYPHVALFGKSGLGKSSLLQAGLFPLLRQKKTYLPVYMRLNFQADAPLPPLMQALQALLAALRNNACDHPVPEPDETLWHYLHRRDLELWSDDNYPLTPVLVFDQFEEIFAPRAAGAPTAEALLVEIGDLVEPSRMPAELTRAPASADDAARLRRQLQALDLQKRRYRTVIAFREDHLAAFKAWEPRIPSLLQNFLALQPMRRDQAISAVSEPGSAVLEPGVAPRIVDFVGNLAAEAGDTVVANGTVEPVLLSLCCTQLNSRRTDGRRIDAELLRTAGDDILQRFYEDAVHGLPVSVRRFIETVLVQGRRYRGAYAVKAVIDEKHMSADDLTLLTDKRRLLRVDPQSGVEKVELIHDRLVGVVVKALDARVAEEDKAKAALAKIAAAEARAEKAAHAQRTREAALAAADAERQRLTNERLRRWRSRLMAACVLLAVFGGLAIWQGWRAQQQTALAVAQAASAAAATLEAETERKRAEKLTDEARNLREAAMRQLEQEAKLRKKADAQSRRATAAEKRSVESLRVAVALRLATEGTATLSGVRAGTDRQALLELVAAHRMAQELPAVSAQLLDAVIKYGRLVRLFETPGHLAALSPDGRLVVTDAGQRALRITDVATGRPVGPDLRPPGESPDEVEILALAWSPDGRRIVASGDDKRVLLWDATTRQLVRTIDEPQDLVRAVAFSLDSRELATGDDEGKVHWFNTADGKPRGEPLEAHKDWIQALAYSPDGKLLASSSDDGRIVLADTATQQQKGAALTTDGSEAILALAFSPDGRRLASGGRDKMLRVWDVATGTLSEPLAPAHDDSITALAFRPDGVVVASASEDRTVRYWGSTDGKMVGEPQRGHDAAVRSLQFSTDGQRLLTAGADSTARLWHASLGPQLGQPLRGAALRYLLRVRFGENGRALDGYYDDGTVSAWNLDTGRQTSSTERTVAPVPLTTLSLRDRILSMLAASAAYSGNGQRFIEWRTGGQLIQRDVASRTEIEPALQGPPGRSVTVTYNDDGRYLVALAKDKSNSLWMWDTAAKQDTPLKRELPAMGRVAAFAPHGRHLAVGLSNGRVQFLDRTTGLTVGDLGVVADSGVAVLAYSDDGERLAIGDGAGGLQTWSLAGGRAVRLWRSEGHVRTVTAVAFSPDGQRLATGGTDASVRLWEATTGNAIGIPMRGHASAIVSLAFSPDGKRIASAARDRTARVWPAFDTWADIVCAKLGRDLDRTEWGEIVATDVDYLKPCPGLPVASAAEISSTAAARQRARSRR